MLATLRAAPCEHRRAGRRLGAARRARVGRAGRRRRQTVATATCRRVQPELRQLQMEGRKERARRRRRRRRRRRVPTRRHLFLRPTQFGYGHRIEPIRRYPHLFNGQKKSSFTRSEKGALNGKRKNCQVPLYRFQMVEQTEKALTLMQHLVQTVLLHNLQPCHQAPNTEKRVFRQTKHT